MARLLRDRHEAQLISGLCSLSIGTVENSLSTPHDEADTLVALRARSMLALRTSVGANSEEEQEARR
jgi:hypothetical protein